VLYVARRVHASQPDTRTQPQHPDACTW
jgi:hypothetical protein